MYNRKRKIMTIFLATTLALMLVALAFLSTGDRKLLLRKAEVFNYNETERTYRIYVPKNIANEPKMIFVFHGFSSDSRQMAYITGFHNSTPDDTIVVYPDASKPNIKNLKRGWNAGYCCGSGYINKVDDVGYIKALSSYLSDKYKVQQQNTFATGFSNGGMFVNRLATDIPDSFGGFASVAGSIGTEEKSLNPSQPASILHIHGEQDTIIPFKGGPGSSDNSFIWKSFDQTKKTWEDTNQASGPQIIDEADIVTTTFASHQHPLKTLTYKNNAHTWPDWRLYKFWQKESEGSQQVVKFFSEL